MERARCRVWMGNTALLGASVIFAATAVAGWAVAEKSRKTLARLHDMAQLHSNMMHAEA